MAAPQKTTVPPQPCTPLEPGMKMQDGSVYVGISPTTGTQMFAMPADAPVTLTFNRAADYATKLNQAKILRHGDWRLPTKDELSLLFKNRDQGALKGTFNSTGSAIAGWYWSSTPEHDYDAWSQRFTDGVKANLATIIQRSVRCVRSTPRP